MLFARLDLPELADQPWWPAWARDAMTGYLHTVIARTRPYAPAIPALASLLRDTGARQIVDLCSGAGGPWPALRAELSGLGTDVDVICTDLAPNAAARERLATTPRVRYHDAPISALDVPPSFGGARTVFSALHHFAPDDVRAILASAQEAGAPFAAFEATHRSLRGVLATFVIPLAVLALMPAVRPRHWRAIVLTYLPPLFPLAIWWDGVASTFRTYRAVEIRRIVASLPPAPYDWEVAELAGGPLPVLAVIGKPRPTTPQR